MENFDIMALLKAKPEFLKSSEMKVSLDKTEIFVITERVNRQLSNKRSIVFPVCMQYNHKEYLTYEATNNICLAKTESLYIIEKVVLRVSAVDSLVVLDGLHNIKNDMEEYKKMKAFPKQSQFTEFDIISDKSTPGYRVIQNMVKILQDGVQIVSILEY